MCLMEDGLISWNFFILLRQAFLKLNALSKVTSIFATHLFEFYGCFFYADCL